MSTRQSDSARRGLTDASHSSVSLTENFPFFPASRLRKTTCIASQSATSCSLSPAQGGLTNLALLVLGNSLRSLDYRWELSRYVKDMDETFEGTMKIRRSSDKGVLIRSRDQEEEARARPFREQGKLHRSRPVTNFAPRKRMFSRWIQ